MRDLFVMFIFLAVLTAGCAPEDTNTRAIQQRIKARYDQEIDVLAYNDNIKTIGLISKYDSDPFINEIMDHTEKTLRSEGFNVVRKSPYSYSNKVSEQQKILQEFVLSGVDGIIITPNDGKALNPYIREGLNKNIPIIIVDTPIDTYDLITDYTNMDLIKFLQIDNYQASYDAASSYFKTLEGHYRCLIIAGNLNAPNAVDRRNGTIDAINQFANIELAATVDAQWQENIAYESVMTHITNNINLISCSSDRMAMGAILALKELGMEEEVLVTGFDGSESGMTAVSEGSLQYTVSQETRPFGEKAAELIIQCLTGVECPQYNYIDTQPIFRGDIKDEERKNN